MVEIQLTSNSQGSNYNFPDNKIIRDPFVWVYGLESFTQDQITKTPGGLTPVSADGALGLVVNLNDDVNAYRTYQIPYFTFISSQNTGYIREFKPFKCVLTNSNVSIVDSTNITAGQAALFNLLYAYDDDYKKHFGQKK